MYTNPDERGQQDKFANESIANSTSLQLAIHQDLATECTRHVDPNTNNVEDTDNMKSETFVNFDSTERPSPNLLFNIPQIKED